VEIMRACSITKTHAAIMFISLMLAIALTLAADPADKRMDRSLVNTAPDRRPLLDGSHAMESSPMTLLKDTIRDPIYQGEIDTIEITFINGDSSELEITVDSISEITGPSG
jgi:hypothetical protein